MRYIFSFLTLVIYLHFFVKLFRMFSGDWIQDNKHSPFHKFPRYFFGMFFIGVPLFFYYSLTTRNYTKKFVDKNFDKLEGIR